MGISENGVKFIENLEGFRDKAYLDSRGVPTIGFGHTAKVKLGDQCTREQAGEWLEEDLQIAESAVRGNVKTTLNQNQFDALTSFVFNVGAEAFRRSSLLKYLNLCRMNDAAEEFARWIYSGGKVIEGLKNRRLAEQSLFLKEV